jgi:hypothetical protein
VTTECKVYALQIDPDPRLAAAAGGVAHFVANAAGLTDQGAQEFQKSVVAACLEAFESLAESANLQLSFSWSADRLEVAFLQQGDAPAVGLDNIAGFAQQIGSAAAFAGVDRVQFETKAGMSVTRLTKFLGHAPKIA